MTAFRYKHGDRPLEGYTIEHGAGRGGFGEVYYAVSDSGREVALKVIQGFEQIELRGVSQCMNLKSPHLVTIFDVRHNPEGTPFVIMEYVSGPSLRQIIDEAPGGLGPQKTAFFLREIGKGLAFLHDCGIVHRDLKPGNIFYENGYVKIGDYGLSKAISTTQHSAQTITVGTVHYMAPEIGAGRYDKTIDIYAMGAMVHEMLTGQVPYLGASPGEILMKHMTGEPDVSAIEEPFATVIRKAMARNPADRYQNVQEMIEAVFGAEHIRQSVSVFAPESLSMVAARVAVGVGGGSSGPRAAAPVALASADAPSAQAGDSIVDRAGRAVDRAGDRIAAFSDRMIGMGVRAIPVAGGRLSADAPAPRAGGAELDVIPRGNRRLLAVVAAVSAGGCGGWLESTRGQDTNFFFGALMALGAAIGILAIRRRLLPALEREQRGVQRVIFALGGGIAGILASVVPYGATQSRTQEDYLWTWLAVGMGLMFMDWVECGKPSREGRISFGHTLWAVLCGLILSWFVTDMATMTIGILAGVSLAVQVASPWAGGRHAGPRQPGKPSAPTPTDAMPTIALDSAPSPAAAPAAPAMAPSLPAVSMAASSIGLRPVPQAARWIWLFMVPVALSAGMLLLITMAMDVWHVPDEFALAFSFGVGCLILAALCLTRFLTRRFKGWWAYLIRPLLLLVCVQSVLTAGMFMANGNLRNEELLAALFFIIFPLALLPVLLAIRPRRPRAVVPPPLPSFAASAPAPIIAPADGMPAPPPEAPTMMPPIQPIAPAVSQPHAGHSVDEPFSSSVFLSLLAAPVLLLGMALAMAAAVDLPGCIAAGVLDPSLAQHMDREMGFARWPQFLRTAGWISAYVFFFIAAILLILARRRAGAGHMVRVIVGLGGLLLAASMLDGALTGQWQRIGAISTGSASAASIEAYINNARSPLAIMSLVAAAVSFVILLWPASRHSVATPALEE